jgi:hypothetical protein
MKREELIYRIKINNESFFSRDNKRFFGDQKYQWLTCEKILRIHAVTRGHGFFKDFVRTVDYTWGDDFKLISIYKAERQQNDSNTVKTEN